MKGALGRVMGRTPVALRDRARAVIDAADTDNFVQLIKHAGLDPKGGDLRFSNWSNIRFDHCDLREFDFTGCNLVGCTFEGAQIAGARFDGANIRDATLRNARDWNQYLVTWVPSKESVSRRHLRDMAVFQDAPFAPEMVVLPSGSFYMGSPDGSGGEQGEVAEDGRTLDEGARRLAQIVDRFAIGKFTVTRAEFAKFISETKHVMPESMQTYEYRKLEVRKGRDWQNPGFSQTDEHPAVGVRWEDAVAYADWLTELTGSEYRLPSELEWEYAARAGSSTAYWWGDNISDNQANFSHDTYGRRAQRRHDWAGATVPVGRYQPNPWGLFQVHGNVWEWCDNLYENRFKHRAMRGGSWRSEARNCRSANRSKEDKHSNHIGFRILRVI